jgi:SAM-dependent methyltransferase
VSLYDSIAELYDPWSVSVTEDVGFYVEEAERAGSPVVELAVGTGRIAVPTAAAGVRVIGIDSSPGMLEVCRRRAELAGVSDLLDLRLGELEAPPVEERVALVTCPFRSFLHLLDDDSRLRALGAARELLLPGGRLVFDVFAPSASDIADTNGRWLEREPGIFERADWDSQERTLTLSVRGESGETSFVLAWLSNDEWRELLERAGFQVVGCYGWFDRRPYAGGEDTVWIARRPARRVAIGHRPGSDPGHGPKRRLEQLDRVADRDLAGLDDPRQHPALALQLLAKPVAQLVHPVTGIADHGDLEHRLVADLHSLADRPLLDVGPLDGQVLADRARLDADRLEMLGRDEQHLALRRVRMGAAFEPLPGDRAPALVGHRDAALAAG